MPPDLLITPELAELLRVSPRTVESWRVTGAGPSFRKLGRGRVLYDRRDVEAWLEASTRRSTADPSPEDE